MIRDLRVPPAAHAVGLLLWTRHRGGWIGLGVALGMMAVVYPAVASLTSDARVLGWGVLPLVGLFGFAMNALLFADEAGNLASGYPRRLFTLPVPSRTLALWPILFGALGMAALWMATATLVLRPSGYDAPRLLPALGLAAFLVWIQALSWWPVAWSWVRIAVTGMVPPALIGFALWLVIGSGVSRGTTALVLAAELVVAVAIALRGVARARHGDASTFGLPFDRETGRLGARLARRPLRTPAAAQRAYEWRSHGWLLPVFVGGMMLMVASVILVAGRAGPNQRPMFAIVLLMPLLMAGSVGPNLARMEPVWVKPGRGLAFTVTRPLSSRAIVHAKFAAALRSAAVGVVLSVTTTTALLALTGGLGGVLAAARELAASGGMLRVAALGLGVPSLLVALTWRSLTDPLPACLTGRKWIEPLPSFLFAGLILASVLGGVWLQTHPERRPVAMRAVPWLLVVAALLKAALAAWSFDAALRRRLIPPRDALLIPAAWALAVALLAALVRAIAPAALPVSFWAVPLALAVLLPLARFPLSVLAFEWRRRG